MRSLYQCFKARVQGDKINCSAGNPLSPRKDGSIDTLRLARGDALELGICADCADYDHMGNPVKPEDRGWLKQ